jgi:hypothetical protein
MDTVLAGTRVLPQTRTRELAAPSESGPGSSIAGEARSAETASL